MPSLQLIGTTYAELNFFVKKSFLLERKSAFLFLQTHAKHGESTRDLRERLSVRDR